MATITEKLTNTKKGILLSIILLYFVVGFAAIIIVIGRLIGANYSGMIALLYLLSGWYFLVKRNGLFNVMHIKHT